jgi:hypothetical protein
MLTAQSAQSTARIAGLGYLVIFVLAILANFIALEPLGVAGDAVATASGIAANEQVYRAGVAAFMVVLIADVIVGWALFVVLRPADANLSLLVLLFRLAYTIGHIGVVLGLVGALSFAAEPNLNAAMGAHASALAYQLFFGHQLGFAITLIFFGVHLFLLGVLIDRARYIPQAIGWLLMVAGIAYVADGFGRILVGSYGSFADLATTLIILPTVIAEGALMLWLLLRGVDKSRFEAAAAGSARG